MGKYDDIIGLPRPISKRHAPMSRSDRAAQFSPFAALTGYDAVIDETARLTDQESDLDEMAKQELDRVLQQLKAVEQEHPEVVLTVFVPDAWKEGGAYEQICGNLKRIDPVEGTLVLTDLRQVKLERIRKISSGGLKG